MENRKYHHGNLQEALMEEGISLLHEEGVAQFSLRKLAKRVGVSPTACYNHYENVEALQKSMRDYVTKRFVEALKQAMVPDTVNSMKSTVRLGVAYVTFFAENPHYFSYLFDTDSVSIRLTKDDMESDYEPFILFREFSLQCMKAAGIPKSHFRDNLVVMWSTVHGLAAMANMKAVSYEGDWGQLTADILQSKLELH